MKRISRISIRISDVTGKVILTSHCIADVGVEKKIICSLDLSLEIRNIITGDYYCTVWIGMGDMDNYLLDYCSVDNVLHFNVVNEKTKFWAESWGSFYSDSLSLS